MTKANALNWICLGVLIIASILAHYWVWGLLFIFWAIYALKSNHSHLLFPISKQSEPPLYWSINLMWLVFGIWYLTFDLLWRLGVYTIFGYNLYPNP